MSPVHGTACPYRAGGYSGPPGLLTLSLGSTGMGGRVCPKLRALIPMGRDVGWGELYQGRWYLFVSLGFFVTRIYLNITCVIKTKFFKSMKKIETIPKLLLHLSHIHQINLTSVSQDDLPAEREHTEHSSPFGYFLAKINKARGGASSLVSLVPLTPISLPLSTASLYPCHHRGLSEMHPGHHQCPPQPTDKIHTS